MFSQFTLCVHHQYSRSIKNPCPHWKQGESSEQHSKTAFTSGAQRVEVARCSTHSRLLVVLFFEIEIGSRCPTPQIASKLGALIVLWGFLNCHFRVAFNQTNPCAMDPSDKWVKLKNNFPLNSSPPSISARRSQTSRQVLLTYFQRAMNVVQRLLHSD